jgi:hypothetical protein
MGDSVLVLGRRDPALLGKSVIEAMIVITASQNDSGPAPLLAAAARAKAQGIILISGCVREGCDRTTMRQVASGPRWFHDVRASSGLDDFGLKVLRDLGRLAFRRLTITDALPPNIGYVGDSADPRYDRYDGATMVWNLTHVTTDGVTVTYLVEPLEPGTWPVNLGAQADYDDYMGRSGRAAFPVPEVHVLRPPQPLPTLPTTTPSPTPTPRPPILFVPWAEK